MLYDLVWVSAHKTCAKMDLPTPIMGPDIKRETSKDVEQRKLLWRPPGLEDEDLIAAGNRL
jgi:hypothetical protein